MIKVETQNGACRIKAQGNLLELTADMCAIISGVYNGLSNESKPLFKEAVEFMISSGNIFEIEKEESEEDKLLNALKKIGDLL